MKTKKAFLIAAGIATALLILLYACKQKTTSLPNEVAKKQAVLDGSGEAYLVDTATSVIEWIGSTPGNYKHSGTINLSKGQFTIKDQQLTSGKFTIDINSIANLDQQGKDRANLENHLKDKDFFEVGKFPFGEFEITEVQTDSTGLRIIGNLTLKGITNAIVIPAKIRMDDQFILAETPTFIIDRTKWGIVYNSGVIGTLKDELINDEIALKLKIVAKKKYS
jgi:polyisoprenoid-binding protein YceI